MYKKCPVCDINYIQINEEFCSVCKNNLVLEKKKHKFAPKDYEPKNKIEIEYLKYLEDMGYAMYTPSDLQSTAYSYLRAINNILYHESITWEYLAINYDKIINEYDLGGKKEHIGNKSHKTVINALKRFKDFIYFKKPL